MTDCPYLPHSPISLRDVQILADASLLFLAPHPDDFDAAGVTMHLLQANGNAIYVAVDHSGSGVEDDFCSPPTLEVKAAIREAEQRRSCRLFGLPDDRLIFLPMAEDASAQLLDSPLNPDLLAALIASMRPALVCLPHGNDTNVGHQRMVALARRILSGAGYPITALYIRDPKTISLRVDAYTVFGEDEAQWKARLLRCHESQHRRNLRTRGHGFDERILNTNRQIAQELGVPEPFAEAFEIERFGPGSTDIWRPIPGSTRAI